MTITEKRVSSQFVQKIYAGIYRPRSHVSINSLSVINPFCLCHHGVLIEQSKTTKLRVIFNHSCLPHQTGHERSLIAARMSHKITLDCRIKSSRHSFSSVFYWTDSSIFKVGLIERRQALDRREHKNRRQILKIAAL